MSSFEDEFDKRFKFPIGQVLRHKGHPAGHESQITLTVIQRMLVQEAGARDITPTYICRVCGISPDSVTIDDRPMTLTENEIVPIAQ